MRVLDSSQEVTPKEMALARDRRARKQRALINEYQSFLLSFTLNIPGPIKNKALYTRAFNEGLHSIRFSLDKNNISILALEELRSKTGCEALFSLKGAFSIEELKALGVEIENTHPLGRIFDIDIIDLQGRPFKGDRKPRGCFICQDIPSLCRREGRHTLEELIDFIDNSICNYIKKGESH